MRFSIRVKQIVGVTAIVGLAVVALSVLYAARLTDVVLHESYSRGQWMAKTILHHAGVIVTGDGDPYAQLREDTGLRSIIESSAYSDNITTATIVDATGVIVIANLRSMVGQLSPRQDDLAALDAASPYAKLKEIYTGDGRTLEVRERLMRGDEEFGSIRIGVSTLLMRRQLEELFWGALFTVAAALGISVFVAGVFAQLLLRPIHVLRSGLTRLGKGEFGVTLDLPPGDEFGELGDFFNTVSQQLSADRSLLAGQKANLQTAVEHLEDAVALFNPSGELLFSNPAMQPTLPADAMGRALQGLLPNGHPYRTLVEETLATRRSRGPVQSQRHPTEPVTRAVEERSAAGRGQGGRRGTDHDARHHGHERRARRRAARLAQPRAPVPHAVHARLLAQAGGARPADGRDRARGEEPAQRDDDSPRAAADEDPRHGAWPRSRSRGGGRRDAGSGARPGRRRFPHPSRAPSSTSPLSRARFGGWMRSCRGSSSSRDPRTCASSR